MPWLTLYDDQITAAELEAAVAERVHQPPLNQRPPDFPTYGTAARVPALPADFSAALALYHHLRLANNLYAQAATEPLLADSAATQMPVVGRLWKLVRRQAHGLILFYVNRHVAHQTVVNSHLVHTLNEMTRLVAHQQAQIAALQTQLDQSHPTPPIP